MSKKKLKAVKHHVWSEHESFEYILDEPIDIEDAMMAVNAVKARNNTDLVIDCDDADEPDVYTSDYENCTSISTKSKKSSSGKKKNTGMKINGHFLSTQTIADLSGRSFEEVDNVLNVTKGKDYHQMRRDSLETMADILEKEAKH